MKTLEDFKNENKGLEKLEMAKKTGGITAPPEITEADDSNWNCGDVTNCVDVGGGGRICLTTPLPG
jgi:hypothetical protein